MQLGSAVAQWAAAQCWPSRATGSCRARVCGKGTGWVEGVAALCVLLQQHQQWQQLQQWHVVQLAVAQQQLAVVWCASAPAPFMSILARHVHNKCVLGGLCKRRYSLCLLCCAVPHCAVLCSQEFLEAMTAYYYGDKPNMTDEEFSLLKDELIWNGSKVRGMPCYFGVVAVDVTLVGAAAVSFLCATDLCGRLSLSVLMRAHVGGL